MTPSSPSSIHRPSDEIENIWSSDVEESLLEALTLYPPCGRRKIILSDEGKIYGRNELVSRHIKLRTGKVRTRKQVSSHLQVLMKRVSKESHSGSDDRQTQAKKFDHIKLLTALSATKRRKHSTFTEQMETTLDIKTAGFVQTSTINDADNLDLKSIQNIISPLPANNEQLTPLSDCSTFIDPYSILDSSISPSSTDQILINANIMSASTNQEGNSAVLVADAQCYQMSMIFPNLVSPAFSPENTDQSSCSSFDGSISFVNGSYVGTQNSPKALTSSIIGDEKFRLCDLSTYIELKRTMPSSLLYPYAEISSIHQHDIIRLHWADAQMQISPSFETISIDQISDKFPVKDGLNSLFESNPNGSFFLIKFWADFSFSFASTLNSMNNKDESFFTSFSYSSCTYQPIQISTRLCSFGKQVLEKVEINENPQRDPFNEFVYRFDRSPLCDYMTQFIRKLRSLPNIFMMNSVLENFTMLQIIRSHDTTRKLLLCLAFVFEAGMFGDGHGPKYQVYKLVKN